MAYTQEIARSLLSGPLADRPLATVGRYWYFADDEDGGTLYKSDGATWTQIASGVSASGGVPTSRTLTAGDGLSGGGDLTADRTFAVNVDASTIEINTDTLRVKADGITANEIAANAVTSSELADNAVDTNAVAAGAVTEAKQTLADNTTGNVTSSAHGYTPKSPADATKFLNGAATPAFAQVKDSDLSTSDITTNDVSISKHGFVPKAPNDATKFLDGTGAWSVPPTGAVSSVFGRTGAVIAVSGDYAGVVNAFLSGATAASRYVGATTSGAPASGSFLKGDFVIAQDGKIFVCTAAGSPGTWADVSSGAAVGYATPSIALGSAAAAGAAATVIRSDATIAAFDTTNPSTQAFGDAAAVGTAAFAARRDHKHAMPAAPTTIVNDTAWNTKGDIAAATAADTATVLGVGANDYVLTADSAQATGLKWAPPVARVRAFATPTSGAGLDIQAAANYKLVDFNIFAAQTSAANTAMNIIITYSDATTDQLATTASQVACLNGNDGGAIRTVSGGYSASQTFQTKDVTRIQVLGVGAGAGSRVAVASALQVRI